MNARVDHILDEALGLPAEERSALVAALIDSLEGADEAAVAQSWLEEVKQRRQGLRQGTVSAVPWSEVRSRLAAL